MRASRASVEIRAASLPIQDSRGRVTVNIAGGASAVGAALAPSLAMVPRQCPLRQYQKLTIPGFTVSGEIVAYASPDSTFAVTRNLIEGAKKSIKVSIYDFSAEHMKELLFRAMERGVRVSLMLDIDSEAERSLFKDMVRHGSQCVPAPSCASDFVHYFASCHQKFIVIDDSWVLVQSGNYSNNSIPMNPLDGESDGHFRRGNRDTGLAVKSPVLAKFFSQLLKADMKLETDAEGAAPASAGRMAFPETEVLAAGVPVPRDCAET